MMYTIVYARQHEVNVYHCVHYDGDHIDADADVSIAGCPDVVLCSVFVDTYEQSDWKKHHLKRLQVCSMYLGIMKILTSVME